MMAHLVFRGCSEPAKEAIRKSWERKEQRLRRLLKRFSDRDQQLRLTVSLAAARKVYDARTILALPTGTMVAEASASHHDAALEEVTDRLAQEIRRHKERLRREELIRRHSHRQHDFAAASELLERYASGRDRPAFFELLHPLTGTLQDHAARELTIAQLEGAVYRREFSVADLMDEVITHAFDAFERRPRDLPLDRWLFDLLHECLDRWATATNFAGSLSQELRQRDPLNQPDDTWVQENDPCWAAKPERLTLEEVLPSSEAPEPWLQASAHEERHWVLAQLHTFARDQRRAFMLHTLEGWTPGDIAHQQHRRETEVKADIESVRQTLSERLHTASVT